MVTSPFPTLFILGPTASGKSALGFRLAKKLGACIVNADSIQLYQGLVIGSAAPSEEERLEVDHYLFQVVPKGENWTAFDYEERAWKVINEQLQHRPVVIVGGSGFYLQALEKGMGPALNEDESIKKELERELEEKGAASLYEELRRVDPESARRIHFNDSYRVLRALGYFRTFQRPFSEDQKQTELRQWPGVLYKVGLTGSQTELVDVVEKRVNQMMKAGFLDEVKGLMEEGLSEWWPMKSVGYREVLEHLSGELAESELIPRIVQKTLSLAKRQKTWFKRDSSVKWYPFQDSDRAFAEILSLLS